MPSKYISGTYASGYTLTGVYSEVTIGPTGLIGGTGLVGGTSQSYAIVNLGRVAASVPGAAGMQLQAGGTIANGSSSNDAALVAGVFGGTYGGLGGTGGGGIALSGGGSIGNWGTVAGGGGGFGRFAGGVGGGAIVLSGGGSIGNWGTVAGGAGGGSYFTQAAGGGGGIVLSGGGGIDNWGTVAGGAGGTSYFTGAGGGGGIMLSDSGSVRNWGLVAGGLGGGGAGEVGGFAGPGGGGIVLSGGGSIENWGTAAGGHGGTSYAIRGGNGGGGIALSGGGSIANWGTVVGGAGGETGSGQGIGPAFGGGGGGDGIVLSGGGSIENRGAVTGGAGGSVSRYFTGGGDGVGGSGIKLSDGGSIANWGAVTGGAGGSSADGLSSGGGTGIYLRGGSVANWGTVEGGGGGVGGYLGGGGGTGIYNYLTGGSIDNSGLVAGGAGGLGDTGDYRSRGPGGAGIALTGGSIANRGTVAGGNGNSGIVLSGGTIGNYGTVAGGAAEGVGLLARPAGPGIVLIDGGIATNGGAAQISGGIGIQTIQVGGTTGTTVTNFGTIASTSGTAGTALQFSSAADVLIVEGGSRLVGAATGAGGTLELAGDGGAGTLTGLGSRYISFAQYAVLPGAYWSITGANTIANGATLAVGGTLANQGTLLNGGQLLIAGPGALLDVQAGAGISGEVGFSAAGGRLQIDGTASPGFTISGFDRGDAIDLTSLAFDSSGSATLGAGNLLHVAASGGSFDLQLDPNESFAGTSFTLSPDTGGGTLVGEQIGGQFVFGPAGGAKFGAATLGIKDSTHPVFPFPVGGNFNIEVFTSASLGGTLPALDPGFQAGVIVLGGFIGSNPANYLVGGQLQLFDGDYVVVDAPNGGNIPAKIILGTGNQTVVGAAGDTLVGGSGNQVLVGASGDSIQAGSGATYVDGRAGGSRIVAGANGLVDVIGSTVAGSGDTIIGGSATLNYNPGAGGGHDLIDLSGATGSATINAFGTNGSQFPQVNDTIIAGNGNTFVWGGDGDRIAIGSGPTVTGNHLWGHSTTVPGAAIGFGTNDTVAATSYDTGNKTFSINSTLPGASTAQVTIGGAAGNFDVTRDFLFYANESSATDAQIVATAQSVAGGSSLIALPDGTVVTLIGITQQQLQTALSAGTLFRP